MRNQIVQPRPPHPRRHPRQRRTRPRANRPKLRFSPTAWAKLLFLRDRGRTEVGGFGITTPENLLRVQDVALVGQTCTETFVSFDDAAVAEFFDQQIDLGRRPDQFGRIWIHTHPGDSAEPSVTDRQTFIRVFGECDWAVMGILARGGACFAELHWRQGGPASIALDMEIDFTPPFPASRETAWAAEYDALVRCDHDILLSPMARESRESVRGLENSVSPPSDRFPPFEDDSLANYCRHPLAWEMA